MEARSVTWRKSSYSGGSGGGCVEVAALPGLRYMRDSKNPDGGSLGFAPADFRALVDDIKSGKYDLG